ncbi:MAG: ABC transporter permease [Acidobacteria bacterium]|nr:MAG: ABC transporter permease [Acidobacteriota bacterium]
MIRRASRAATRTAVPLAIVIIWEVVVRTRYIGTPFIPAPSQVLAVWYQWMFGTPQELSDPYVGTWLLHGSQSTYRVLIGFTIAACIGISMGVFVGYFELFADLFDPLIQVLRPIPITAWLPFAVIFFGIQTASAVSLIALGAFFPIVINTTAGVQRVPRSLIRAAQMLGAPKLHILPRVAFPAALPSIFTGLRVGLGMAWVLVIVSEMLAVKGGLGYVLWDAYYYLRMDVIIAAMLSIGALGYISDRIMLAFGNYALRWNEGN